MVYAGCRAPGGRSAVTRPFPSVLTFPSENTHRYLPVRPVLKLEVANQWLHSVFICLHKLLLFESGTVSYLRARLPGWGRAGSRSLRLRFPRGAGGWQVSNGREYAGALVCHSLPLPGSLTPGSLQSFHYLLCPCRYLNVSPLT